MGISADEKTVLHNGFSEKLNGEINTNDMFLKRKDEMIANGGSETKTHVAPMTKPTFPNHLLTKPKPKFMLATVVRFVRFAVECVLCYSLVIAVVIALLPALVVYNVLKFLEQVVAGLTRDAKPISGQDALWQQDSDKNRLIITSIMQASNPGNLEEKMEEFRQIILDRMVHATYDSGELLYPRVRWCIKPGYFQYFFEEEKHFRVEKHVFLWDGHVPTSKQELEEVISKLSGDALPEGLSPWYYCIIPSNYGSNEITVMFRAHHSLGDGVSFSRFLIRQLPDNRVPEKEPSKFSSRGRAYMCAKALFAMGRVLFIHLFGARDRSVLHGAELSGVKKVAYSTESNATDLELIKQIKNVTGTTVNDVLMACLSMAIRGYYKRRGIENPEDFIAAVPVDVRSSASKQDMAFKNRFAIVFLNLPVSVEGAMAQLSETKERMDYIKTSGEPMSTAWIMQLAVALCPEAIIKPILSYVTDKATCVLSNVPGPHIPIKIAGKEIEYMTFWPPQRNLVGIGLSIVTYAGKVYVGVQGDVALMTDPAVILEEYTKAVKQLSDVVLHTPLEMNGKA